MLKPAGATPTSHKRRKSAIRSFIKSEAAGGIALIAASVLALVIANSPAAPAYFGLLKSYVGPLSVGHWVNDVLMSLFFLLVGLEIKREFLDGQLATARRRVLPGLAAVGGMIVPACIYVALNWTAGDLRGWAVPVATDIAFALGVLALFGKRVPVSLRIFLTALAVIDDLFAVTIIALFFTAELSLGWLALAAAALGVLAALNRAGVQRLRWYLAAGALLWLFTFLSGVHATIAAVALALTIPVARSPGAPDRQDSPLHTLEHSVQPWVAFAVLPVFGLANAGVSLAGLTLDAMLQPVPLGIAVSLFVGKQIGVFGAVWAAVRLRLADLPDDATTAQVYGVSLLCGIGFTMSLFIGLLAFPDAEMQAQVKLGVLTGSLLSTAVAVVVLMLARREKTPTPSVRFQTMKQTEPAVH